MKWKDSNDAVELDDEGGKEPENGRSFSIKKDNGRYHFDQNFMQGKKLPIILVGGGALILVVLLVWLFSGSGSDSGVQPINGLESRIEALENRIAGLEPLAGAANTAAQQVRAISELTKRIDGLEAVFTREIDSLAKRLVVLSSQKTAPAPAPVKAPPPATGAGTAPDQKATYHEVQAGENLYRISLRYNLKLDELLRLNNLKPGATIQPGQKLLVGRQ